MVQPNLDVESLRTLLEQHWLECKHIESERAWFMNAYAVVIGGASAFIIGMGVEDLAKLESSLTFKFFVAFLIAFTFFGFFHTLRWTYAFECHRKRVNKLIGWMKSGPTPMIVWEDLDMDISPIRVMPIPKKGREKEEKEVKTSKWLDKADSIFSSIFFRTRYLFPLLYLVVLIGATLLLCFVIEASTWSKWLLFVIPLVAFLLGVRWCFSLKEAK